MHAFTCLCTYSVQTAGPENHRLNRISYEIREFERVSIQWLVLLYFWQGTGYARRRRSSIESIVSRRDSTHLVLSKDSSAGVRPSVGSRDRGYNLLPLMDGASLRTMRDRIAVGIALLKFNPSDGELISTRGRGVVLYIRLESDRVTRYYY